MPDVSYAPLVLGRSKLRHSHPEASEQPWEAFPTLVQDGDLGVLVKSESSEWLERWNLAHTLAGIRSGYYIHEVQDG